MNSAKSRLVVLSLFVLPGCLAWPTFAMSLAPSCQEESTLQDDLNTLSEDEAKQVQIAERFLTVLESRPRRGTALERVYGHHVEFGTLDDFIESLSERVKENPQDGIGWMLLGLFEAQRGEDAEAVEAFAKAEQFLIDDAMPAYYMGQSLILIGQPDKAVAAFERAIERDPQRPDMLEIFRQLGRVHQRAQRIEAALDVWNRLEKLFPEDPRVQEQIALTMVEEGEYETALPRYEKLAELVTDDYQKTVFKIEAAELKIRVDKKDDGLKDLETLLADLNPTSWLYRDVRHRIEEVFLRNGDQDGLVSYYQNWLKSHPEDVNAMTRLAKFLAASARIPEASEWMEKALTLAPSRTELRKAYIDQLADDQRYKEAAQQYALLVKSAPSNPDYLREWGRLVLKDKELDKQIREQEAHKIWSRIVAARPDDALTNAQVADLYRQSNLEDNAIVLYQKSVELAPNEPQYREYLGEYYHILKRPEKAKETWEQIAEGERGTAVNVARLAEVYHSFGYLDEAVEKIAAAIQLEPNEFTLQVRASEYHSQAGKFVQALQFIDAASKMAVNDEERETALRSRIEIFQTSRTLDEQIAKLDEELSNAAGSAEQWHTLARYLEADRQWPAATAAIESALAKDPKSVLALTTAARIAEQSGDYARAANMNRQLADVDRRSRSEHLMNVARLESQLGKSDEALAAGRELIVSAPGNTDNYEFFAQLCFQLGENETGLDALRKAVRINPTEPHLISALGSALASELRTDEAIEVYWRAFERTDELEDKTSLTQKLTELYEQKNQLDQLLARFERDRREEANRREMTICLAQAFQTSGDFGSARRELESLLTANTRDTNLLQQVSKLCEESADLDAAIAYQGQLAEIAPGHETEFRLAQLLQRRGDNDKASEILVELTRREADPNRLLGSLDSLMTQGSYESVIAVTEPLLREARDDWELLYREAVAWASMDRVPEAKLRFERLLALQLPHDQLGVLAQQKLKRDQARARSDNLLGLQSKMPERPSPISNTAQTRQVSQATGLDSRNVSSGFSRFWTPEIYGVARMAAFGWLIRFEREAEYKEERSDSLAAAGDQDANNDVNEVDANIDEHTSEAEDKSIAGQLALIGSKDDANIESIFDWLYVESLLGNYSQVFEISKRLAKRGGREEKQLYLRSLRLRDVNPEVQYARQSSNQQNMKPLDDGEIELMLKCYDELKSDDVENLAIAGQVAYGSDGTMYVMVNGSYVAVGRRGTGVGLAAILKELELAGYEDKANELLEEQIKSAETAGKTALVMSLLADDKDYERLEEHYQRWQEQALHEIALAPNKVMRRRSATTNRNANSANQLQSLTQTLLLWTGQLAADEENQKLLEVVNQSLDIAIAEGKKRRIQQASQLRRQNSTATQAMNRVQWRYGEQTQNVTLDYPPANDYIDSAGLSMLRQAFETLKRNDVVEDLPALLRRRLSDAQTAGEPGEVYEKLMLGYVLWWMEEKEEAVELLTEASKLLEDDPEFRMQMVSLHQSLGDFDIALDLLDSIKARDQRLIRDKELLALQLAARLGDVDRARDAAERLFGLRLDTNTQMQLIPQMRRLGMPELAEAIVSRMERRSGNQLSSMLSLMSLYQGQGKSDLAQQIAHRILQRTQPSMIANARNPNVRLRLRGRDNESQERTQALNVLKQTGALDDIKMRLEKQLERSPDSQRFIAELVEIYDVTNDRDNGQQLVERAAQANPDSMQIQMLYAQQLIAANSQDKACDQLLMILQKQPAVLSNDFYQIQDLFQRAKRSLELVKAVEKINLKAFGHPYYLINMVTELLRNNPDPNNTDIAVKLFERIHDEFPTYRSNLMGQLRGIELWNNDRVFNVALRSLIPTASEIEAQPWIGLTDISSYGTGFVSSGFNQILTGVTGTPNEIKLHDAVAKAVGDHPNWLGGKAMLALIQLSRNEKVEGKQTLTQLTADKETIESMPVNSCWIVGQELAKFEDTREIAVKLFEFALEKPDGSRMNQLQYTPLSSLVSIYADLDQKEKARDFLLKLYSSSNSTDQYNPGYASSRQIENGTWVAQQLLQLGFPVDSLVMLRGLKDDKGTLEAAVQYNGSYIRQQFESASQQALAALLDDRNLEIAVDHLMDVRDDRDRKKPALELLLVTPEFAKLHSEKMESQFFALLDRILQDQNLVVAISKRLSQLQAENPNDLSIAVANAYVQIKYDLEEKQTAVASLQQAVTANSLEQIELGRRPNNRQRREAALIIPVWLVARMCLDSKQFEETGDSLGQIAIEAARRQIDNQPLVAMLLEWSNLALESGDRDTAEQKLAELLEQVTKRPTSNKKVSQSRQLDEKDATSFHNPALLKGQRLEWLAAAQSLWGGSLGLANVVMELAPQQDAFPSETTDEQPQPKDKTTPNGFVAPLTKSQFQIAILVASKAAENDMPELSMKAAREALIGGSPIEEASETSVAQLISSGGVVRAVASSSANAMETGSSGDQTVATAFAPLLKTWAKKKYDPQRVYELLLPLVFPDTRSQEILMYADSSKIVDAKVNSMGRSLVVWAIKAEQVPNLKSKIAERKQYQTASLPALVLLTQIELEMGNVHEAKKPLSELSELIEQSALPNMVLLAGHAAIEAMEFEMLQQPASSILKKSVEIQFDQLDPNADSRFGELMRMFNKYLIKNNRANEITEIFESFLVKRQSHYARYSGDYGLYLQKNDARLIASEFDNLGLHDAALEFMGRAADIDVPRYDSRSQSFVIPRTVASLRNGDDEERYQLWKKWTLPTEARKSIRFEAGSIEMQTEIPLRFVKFATEPEIRQTDDPSKRIFSNFAELIDAANSVDRLDELQAEIDLAMEKQLDHANILKALVAIASNDVESAKAIINDLIETMDARLKSSPTQPSSSSFWPDYLVLRAALQGPSALAGLYVDKLQYIKSEISAANSLEHFIDSDFAEHRAELLNANIRPGMIVPLDHWDIFEFGHPLNRSDSHEGWVVALENHLLNLRGSPSAITYRYPLAGNFKIRFEADINTNFIYGGTCVGLNWSGVSVSAINAMSGGDQIHKAGNLTRGVNPNLFEIESKDAEIEFRINGYLVHVDDVNPTSPWLTITSGSMPSTISNFVVEGNPEVTKQIELFDKDRMEGWFSLVPNEFSVRYRTERHNESLRKNPNSVSPSRMSVSNSTAKDSEPTFVVKDGELVVTANADADHQSWIWYFRPLMDGEAFNYEFYSSASNENGLTIANPTIGRTAILLDGEKVGERWISSPTSERSQGVEFNNRIDSSPYVVGDSTHLTADGWNQVRIERQGSVARIKVNEKIVYEREVEPAAGDVSIDDQFQFGLFRYANQTMRVRNAVLIGSWPMEVPDEAKQHPFSSSVTISNSDRHLISDVTFDKFAIEHLSEVVRVARSLAKSDSADEAQQMLKQWVLPNETHDNIRLDFEFAQAHDSDSVVENGAEIVGSPKSLFVSPAIELVEVAKRQGTLNSLTSEIEAISTTDMIQQRRKICLLTLTAILSGDIDEASQKLSRLNELLGEQAMASSDRGRRDPEILTLWHTISHPELFEAAVSICDKFLTHETKEDGNKSNPTDKNSMSLRAVDFQTLKSHLELEKNAIRGSLDLSPQHWTAVANWTASNQTFASIWQKWVASDSGDFQSAPGKELNRLTFNSPLRGKFSVSADISNEGGVNNQCWLMYGASGAVAEPEANIVHYQASAKTAKTKTLELKLDDSAEMLHYRIDIDGNHMTTFVNELKIHEQFFDGNPEPWLMLQAPLGTGRIANVSISGEPEIPKEIDLSATDHAMWSPSYYGDAFAFGPPQMDPYGRPVDNSNVGWLVKGDEIRGQFPAVQSTTIATAGEWVESVLLYNRPLLEDGEFEFESYYAPNEFECFPVIGNAVFFFDSEGVYLHELTKGSWSNETKTSPTANDRIPDSKSPNLKAGWNRFLVAVKGDQATLSVNDQVVATIKLNIPVDRRKFGLFRFKDKTESRVRSIRYRGDWPKNIPDDLIAK